MNEKFIAKLETNKFLIGSFDAYLETTKQLIKNNSNINDEEVEIILKGMPQSLTYDVKERIADKDRGNKYPTI